MKVRTRPLLLAAALLAGTVVPLASPAAADTAPVPLELSRLGRILVDEAHSRVFLSPGPGGSGVRVTDLGGRPVATVDGLPDAGGMALTADGRSVWVAVPSAGLVRLSTTTLAVEQRIPLPTGQCAGDVAVSGDRLVYGHSCTMYLGSGGYGGVGVVDATTGATYGNVTSGPWYEPVVAAGPAGQVYAADAGLSPTSLSLFDVTGSAPVLVAARASVCSNLRDLSASPDGSQVVTSCGSPYQHTAYSAAAGLAVATSYPTGAYPLAGAWSGDGKAFAGGVDSAYGTDVSVYPAGTTTPSWVRDFGSSTALLQPRGLALSADGSRAWAVTRSSTGGLDLRVLGAPSASVTSLTLASDPPSFAVGEGTHVGGWLSSDGAGVAGVSLTVTRAATGEAPVTLPPVTTRTDGTYVFQDSPAQPGTYTYTASWAGDATRSGAQAMTSVTVQPLSTGLELLVEHGWGAPSEVFGTVRLTYSGTQSPAGRTVRLTRQGGGISTELPAITTDAYGGAEFSDVPPGGSTVYTATVDAYGSSPAATATAAITTVSPTTLTAQAPAAATAGSPVRVSGLLSAPTAPVGAATVSVTRSGCGSSWSAVAVTTADGAWSVEDPAAPAGACTWSASYAGDAARASASASTSSTVLLRTTTLDLTVTRGTGSTKKLAHVTGQLSAWHTNRTLTITAQPSGGAEVVLVSAAVDGTGRLTATYQPKTTTTYRVQYAGDDWYQAATAQRTQ